MGMEEEAAPETKGVSVEVLATVDLDGEIEGMEGRQLRMRMVTIDPGGVFGPLHNHVGRPGTVYILQGTITTTVMARPGNTGPEWAGRKTGTLPTGWRTGEKFRRWKSPWTSSTSLRHKSTGCRNRWPNGFVPGILSIPVVEQSAGKLLMGADDGHRY